MPDTLPVHVNREELHSLDVPPSFEVSDTFAVALENHGEALHVHLHLDDALSEVATLEANNHYVESNSAREVQVTVNGDPPRPVHGKLKIVSGYGAETRYVDVDLVEPADGQEEVAVDESLAQPGRTTERSTTTDSLANQPEVLVLLLGIVALVVALVAALVIESTAVLLGSLAVLGGVFVAMYMLLQEE